MEPIYATADSGQTLTPDLARLRLSRLSSGEGAPLTQLFYQITEIAAETLSVDRVGIWLFVDDHKALRCAHLYEAEKNEHSEGVTLRVADFPLYFSVLEDERVTAASDILAHPTMETLAEAYFNPLNIRATLDAPIYVDGRVIGVVCHEHIATPRDWSAEERDFAVSVAEATALKIKGAQLADARETLRTQDAQLSEARRLDVVGRTAAGLAHDFNTLLTVMHGCAIMLARLPNLPLEAREWTRHIIEASERGTALVGDLARCARESDRPARVVSPVEVVTRMLPLLRAAAGANCPITLTTAAHVGKVFIEPSGLERVLLNLVVNSRDAMPRGGPIGVQISPAGSCSAGQPLICIEVKDVGIGIPKELCETVFEPFFTTKKGGRGTGLGLAVVKQVVDRAGGEVRIASSEPGQGTIIQVLLPRVSATDQ